jgi:hypothetical protein
MKKLGLLLLAVLVGVAGYAFLNVEAVKKWTADKKADLVGTNRTVFVYAPMTKEVVKVYKDSNLRYTKEGPSNTSLWLGSKDKKVDIIGLGTIVEDN